MIEIGVQSQNIVYDENPSEGFERMKRAGFTCCDFSLNEYLLNKALYRGELNSFFDNSDSELEAHFRPHKEAAENNGIRVHQMHMPYPLFVPETKPEHKDVNRYLWDVVAPKSLKVCAFFDCKYIVVHGFKLKKYYGSEAAEWAETERFFEYLAPMAKEMGITMCMENIYNNLGGHIVEGPGCDAAKATERIDRINDKYGAEVLGFCFDTGHANIAGLDLERFVKTLGSRLKVLHIHDNDGERDLHQLPFTFTKLRENKPSTDWEGFIRALRSIGFDRVLSFETAPVLKSFPTPLRDDALHMIARIGRYFADELSK